MFCIKLVKSFLFLCFLVQDFFLVAMYRTLLKWSYRTCFAGNRREDRKEPASPPRGPARIADVWVRPHTSVRWLYCRLVTFTRPGLPQAPAGLVSSRLCVEETQASMQRTAGNPRVHAFSARSLCPIGNCPTMRTKPSLPLLQASQALPWFCLDVLEN